MAALSPTAGSRSKGVRRRAADDFVRKRPRRRVPGAPNQKTAVGINGEEFTINGQPTYSGRTWHGRKIEGLLLNSRMVQAIFDDRNPDTVARWAYPDTKRWDSDGVAVRSGQSDLAACPRSSAEAVG
jgi:hypothetical protein